MFMSVPLSPEKGSSAEDSEMGVTGLAVTGGTFYNYLSTPGGDVALYNEGSSLDSCMGHSSQDGQYHYHANILCDLGSAAGASEADTCLLIGYMRDGVPVYGACKDSEGVVFTSCYSLRSWGTEETITTAGGDFEYAQSQTNLSLTIFSLIDPPQTPETTSTTLTYSPPVPATWICQMVGITNIFSFLNLNLRSYSPDYWSVFLLHDHKLSLGPCLLLRS